MKTAVCLIARDESDYIGEWLIHYGNIGFDEAIVYDHCSIDQTGRIVGEHAATHKCRYIRWNPTTHDPQIDAYNDCIARFGGDFDWIGFFDIDEFLISTSGDTSIKTMLAELGHASAIGINWAMFGSNGLEDKGDELVMEAFTRRAPLDFGANRNVKSIIRPSKSNGLCNNPHWFPVEGARLTVAGTPLTWCEEQEGVVPPGRIYQGRWRLHHYYTRGRTKWRSRLERGQFGGLVVQADSFDGMDRNEILDLSALPAAKAVRNMLSL